MPGLCLLPSPWSTFVKHVRQTPSVLPSYLFYSGIPPALAGPVIFARAARYPHT